MEVSDRILLGNGWYRLWGGLLSRLPANPAFSLIFCPHPPDPLPGGKGEIFSFLMQGASPLASPGLGGMRHWVCLRKAGYGGGLAFWLPACLPFTLAFDSAPIPPTPFPAGRGRFLVFLCKGLRPLHPRGWVRCGTGVACGKRVVAGAYLPCRLLALPLVFFPAPIPPTPFPAGRGRLRLSHARGFAPCIPGAGRGREPAIPAVPIPKAPCGRKIGHKP